MKIRPFLFLAVLVVAYAAYAAAGAPVVHAQSGSPTFVPLANTSGQDQGIQGLYDSTDLADYLNRIFKFAIGIGAIAAVLRLAYAGYLYMGQSDMWSHKGEAKRIMGEVVLGLLLLLGIWLILNQINPDILKLDALKSIQPVSSPVAPTTGGGASTSGGSSRWCIAGGGSCYATEAQCDASRGFLSPRCFPFNN